MLPGQRTRSHEPSCTPPCYLTSPSQNLGNPRPSSPFHTPEQGSNPGMGLVAPVPTDYTWQLPPISLTPANAECHRLQGLSPMP